MGRFNEKRPGAASVYNEPPSRATGCSSAGSTLPSRITASSTCRHSTSPKTMLPLPKETILFTLHSKAALARATRGGRTWLDGVASNPAQSNSSSSGGKSAAVRFIGSTRSLLTTLTTNSPVALTLRSVSFTPVDVKWMISGSLLIALK